MHAAVSELALEKLYVIYPGLRRRKLHDKVELVPFVNMDIIRDECL